MLPMLNNRVLPDICTVSFHNRDNDRTLNYSVFMYIAILVTRFFYSPGSYDRVFIHKLCYV
jgi:hypothetical protein